MRTVSVVGLLTMTAVLLSGCSTPQASSASKSATYQTLAALKAAYTASGSTCSLWIEDDDIQAAAQSGSCGNGITLSTYLTATDLLGEVKLLRDTASGDDDTSTPTRTELLIGANWLITGPHVRQLQPKLGGQLAVINPSAAN